ncbi:benzoate 4-monooxygenase cytochrome p450 [Pleurostoma richardsiae]|uniref:Benzoate 4-monooxygenase cytochrome p450 n=1 Tax=Pleurostoma richardsiae TaxID=41990 RepID=A0AA38RG35_9PEZI|nr:benzoate 4-monooxygenase cytochrome p450 [Pleurostoma richardsiae]
MEQHGRFGDFVRIAPNHISINKVEALAQIYGHKTGFLKSDFYDAFVQVTPVVFNTRDVSTHQRKRRYMNPAFSARALSDFEPYMDAELSKWKRQLFRMLDERGEANLDCAVWTNFLAFDVIGSFAFGRSFGFIEKACDPYNLISTIDIRGEVLNALGTLPPWIRRYMRYNYLDTFWSSGIRATANLEKLGREAFHHRKDSLEDRKDLLSHLFAATDSGSKKPIHEEEIVAESISFIVGGSDTTSSTMTNFIDIVSRDRPWQEKLQQEIDAVYPGEQNDSWIPSEKDISTRLPFVVALLREVMRFRPTSATGLERVTPEGGRVIAGKFIPAKTVVSVPTCGIMMNAEIFENPKEFRPERWLEPDAGRLIEHFVPFSIGPRACIGRNFAWMEILKAVVLLFKLFDVERLSSESTVIREGFFNKAAECTVRIQKRRW